MLDKASFKVTVTGDNFYASDIMQIRLTEVNLGNGGTLSQSVVTDPVLVAANVVEFDFPVGVFADKMWVTVEISFDAGAVWDMADSMRLILFKEVKLTRVRP
jgi:hypothetical protein